MMHPAPTLRPLARRAALIAVSVAALGLPAPASAQVVPTIVGTAGGLAAGVYTTVAVYVTKARFGSYLFSVDDLVSIRLETVPVAALPVAGAWLGQQSGEAVWDAALWGGVGFLGGAVAGAGAGELIWGTEEGRWAGAIIGSALGMLTGATLGARGALDDSRSDPAPVTFSFTLPLGGGAP